LLLNGDRISIVAGPAGQPIVAILGMPSGVGGPPLHLSAGGVSYEVPADALPYLGRGLDPSLFNVADLAAGDGNGTLPVTVTYQGTRPTVPGLTVTRAAAGTASGYFTAASARTFGVALLRQFTADHARDSYGTDGLFADGLTISLSGAPLSPEANRSPGARASSPASPHAPAYVMHTLTVHGTNLAGKPDTGDEVIVVNADNANRFGAGFSFLTESLNNFYQGVAKYSVPAGHYWAVGVFVDANKPTIGMAERFAILSQFTVSGNTSVSVSERTATSEMTVTTPRPSVLIETTLQLIRTGATGPLTGLTVSAVSGYPVFISPTAKRPTVGTFKTYTSGQFASPAGTRQPYFYNVAYQDVSGLVPAQRFTVSPASLATVTARYYADAASTGAAMPAGSYPGQPNSGEAFAVNLAVPEQRTEYFTAGTPPVMWFDEFFQNAGTLDTGQTDSGRTFRPGEAATENWNEYPLHTTTNVNAAGARTQEPELVSASRAGNTLTLDLSPFADNAPGHNAAGYVSVFDGSQSPTSGSYEIEENGRKIASGNPVKSLGETGGDFFTHVKLASGAGTIRVVLDATRTGKLYTLSTQTQTAWTWRSAPAGDSKVSAGWACDWSPTTGPAGRDCAPQPLLTLDYSVAGLALTGTAPAGPQAVTINAGHMALTHWAKVTSLTAEVSFDGGSRWQPATVTGGNGRYRATFTAPASGYVTLKVTAGDAEGGQIAETIIRAYATGSAPAAASGGLRPACPPAPAGQMRCYTLYAPQPGVNKAMADGAAAAPAGWGAGAIESAYRLPVAKNPHQTVAVVDAYSTPNLASYLNTYRKQYGLAACTTGSGCLRIVNQNGKAGPLPQSGVSVGWALETAVDVDMVSAACPKCHILVVEANSPSFSDLGAAENTAARLGAPVISNSYGGREGGFSMPYAKDYDHPGHTIVVSSGDDGFSGANFPAVLAAVTAVGGTELAKAKTARGWTEKVWNADGGASASGCSAYIAKPAWQHDTHCSMRTTTDVSAVSFNVAAYSKDYGGWVTVAGTSISGPLIAGVYGLAGNASKIKPGYEYAHAQWLYDVTSGNNDLVTGTGAQCGGDYLCVAKKGYDAPAGLGTPNGTGAF
jgi:hypothetical protein